MKNGLIIWNVLLTILAGFLVITHFNTKKNNCTNSQASGSRATKSLSIAYFEMDSVEANFNMVKDVKAELTKRENAMTAEVESLAKTAQQRYQYYQSRVESGSMTQEMSEKAGVELKQLENQIGERKVKLEQDYSDYAARQMKDIKTTIENYLKEFNKDKRYSYIVSYEQGLFYYKDSINNITPQLLLGLNAGYKKPGKP